MLTAVRFNIQTSFAQEYYYKDYKVDIQINEDSSFDVMEKQTYFLDGEIDSFYHKIDLNSRSYLSQIEVFDEEGNKIPEENLFISKTYNNYTISWMFPNQNQSFSNEKKGWTIKYKVHRGLDFFKDYDGIYWDLMLMGDGLLSNYTENIKLTIYLASGGKLRNDLVEFNFSNVSDKSESGYYFEDDNTKVVFWAKNLEPAAHYSISQFMPLLPNSEPKLKSDSSFIVSVGWQKGIVKESFDYSGKMVVMLVFLLAFLIILVSFLNNIRTYLRGKKNLKDKRKAIIFRSLPDHLKPAEAGILAGRNNIEECLVATIIDLAIGGYLCIHRKKGLFGEKKYFFEKLKDGTDLSFYEKDIMKVVLKKSIVSSGWIERLRFGSAKFTKLIYKSLVQSSYIQKKILSVWNYFIVNKGDIGSFLFIVWVGIIITLGVGHFFSSTDMFNILENQQNVFVSAGIAHFVSTIAIYLAIILFSVVISMVANIIFSFVFKPSPLQFLTKNGAEGQWKWLGFREYLKTTEEFKKFGKNYKTMEIFLKYLPYAVALGVEKEWAGKFADAPCEELLWFVILKENTGNHKEVLPFSVLSDNLLLFISSSINFLTHNNR